MKKAVIIFLISSLFIFLRVTLRTHQQIDHIVAGINVIALTYIVIDYIINAYKTYIRKLEHTQYPSQTIIERKRNTTIIAVLLSLGCLLTGILYFTLWANSLWNDILSIIALCLSLLSHDIISGLASCYIKE